MSDLDKLRVSHFAIMAIGLVAIALFYVYSQCTGSPIEQWVDLAVVGGALIGWSIVAAMLIVIHLFINED